jgi:predicted DNA-binding protein with PD1-like motif
MRYTKGTVGRVFVLKFEDDDILLKELDSFARKEKVRSAALVFLGALKKGDIVTGPKKPVIPPEPNWTLFKGAWEVFGVGTIFTNSKGPQMHLHTSMGKKADTLTGCIRKDTKVFLVIEAVVFELKGVKANKEIDPRTGLNLLKILD